MSMIQLKKVIFVFQLRFNRHINRLMLRSAIPSAFSLAVCQLFFNLSRRFVQIIIKPCVAGSNDVWSQAVWPAVHWIKYCPTYNWLDPKLLYMSIYSHSKLADSLLLNPNQKLFFGSGALYGLMLDLGLLKKKWGFFYYF